MANIHTAPIMPLCTEPHGQIDLYVDLDYLLELAVDNFSEFNRVYAHEIVQQCMRILTQVKQAANIRYDVYAVNREPSAYRKLQSHINKFRGDLAVEYLSEWCKVHHPQSLDHVDRAKQAYDQFCGELLKARGMLIHQFHTHAIIGDCGRISCSENLTKHWQLTKHPRLLMAYMESSNLSMILNYPSRHWLLKQSTTGNMSIESVVSVLDTQDYIAGQSKSIHIQNCDTLNAMLFSNQPRLRSIKAQDSIAQITGGYPDLELINGRGDVSERGLVNLLHILATNEDRAIEHIQCKKAYSNYGEISRLVDLQGVGAVNAHLRKLHGVWCQFINSTNGGSSLYVSPVTVSQIMSLYPPSYRDILRGVTTLQQAWARLILHHLDPHPVFNLIPRTYQEPKTPDEAMYKFTNLELPVFQEMELATILQIGKDKVGDEVTDAYSYVLQMVLSAHRFKRAIHLGSPVYGSWDRYGMYALQIPTPRGLRELADDRGAIRSILQRVQNPVPAPNMYMGNINNWNMGHRKQLISNIARRMVVYRPESVRALGALLPTYGTGSMYQLVPRLLRRVVMRH